MGEEPASSTQQQTHMSADDLNDGFVLDGDDQKTLAYQVRLESRRMSGSKPVHTAESEVSLCPGWEVEL